MCAFLLPYKNKQIAVLGFGSSGEAAALLLAEEGAMITILDSADIKLLRSKIEKIKLLGVNVLQWWTNRHDSTNLA